MDDLIPDSPDCEMTDADVEAAQFKYSDRAPNDYVVSGPIGDTNGRGRWFETHYRALRYYRMKFGDRFRGVVPEAEQYGKYAFLIRKA